MDRDVENTSLNTSTQLHPLSIGMGVIGFLFLVLIVTASSHQREQLKFMARRALQSQKKKTIDGKPRSDSGGYGTSSLPSFAKSAAEHGNFRMLQRWVKSLHRDINARCDVQWTALHYAARGGHGECVRMLLENQADPSALDDDRITPLHLAAIGGHGLCVKLLLDYRANPFMEDVNRRTAFTVAEDTANFGCARLLQRAMTKVEQNAAAAAPAVSLRIERTKIIDQV